MCAASIAGVRPTARRARCCCCLQMHTGAQHGGSDAALQGKSDAEEAALKRVLSRVAKNTNASVP